MSFVLTLDSSGDSKWLYKIVKSVLVACMEQTIGNSGMSQYSEGLHFSAEQLDKTPFWKQIKHSYTS